MPDRHRTDEWEAPKLSYGIGDHRTLESFKAHIVDELCDPNNGVKLYFVSEQLARGDLAGWISRDDR